MKAKSSKRKASASKAAARFKPARTKSWNADGLLRAAMAFLFLSLPFVVSFTGSDKFRLPKLLYACAGIALIGAAFLLSRRLRPRFRPASWEFLLGALVAYVGIQSFFSRDAAASLEAFFHLSYFAALLLILKEIADRDYLKRLWLGMAAVGAVHAAMTVLQYFGAFPLLVTASGETLEGRLNAAGLIGEVQSGALVFGLAALMMLYWAMAEDNRRLRWLAAGLAGANVAGLVFTRTLTALAAFALGMLLWLIFHHWQHFRTGGRVTRRLALLWAVLGLSLAAGVIAAQESGLYFRLQQVTRNMQRGDWSVATSGRQPVYVLTWKMIQERPITGTGLNSFERDFFFAKADTEFGQSQPLIDQAGAFRQVHNDYLQAWLELGLPGFALFAALLLTPIALALRRIFQSRDSKEAYWLAMSCIGAVYLLVESLAFFPFQLAVSGAMAVLIYAGLRAEQSPDRMEVERPLTIKHWALKAAALSVPAAFLISPQVRIWDANQEIGLAAQLLERARSQPGRLQRAAAQNALHRLERAQEDCPRCYLLYDLKGSALFMIGRHREASEAYDVAAFYLPSPEVFTKLGTAYIALGRAEKARSCFETALRYRPEYEPARQALEMMESVLQRRAEG